MKRTIRLLASVILLVSTSLLGVVSSVRAQQGCTLASWKGAYGFHLTGFFQPAGTTVASFPSTTVGIITADGAGGVSATFTASQNGSIGSFTATGTYSVNANCTGTVAFAGGGAANFVIVAKGTRVLFIGTSPGSVESGVAIKQALSGCSLASLQGTYGVDTSGFFQLSGTIMASLPFANVGIATADGAGGITATGTASDNGTIRSATETGTYTVNPDCTGSATFASGGRANFVIVAGGSQAIFVSTVPGSVQSGVAVLTASAAPSNLFSFTTIDVPGSTETDPLGINNRGGIAGDFADSRGLEHGFFLAGGSLSTVDFPGSLETFGVGINDNGQMAGAYVDSTGKVHGFLFSSGSFTTIDFPGAIATQARGINNPGAIVGRYRDTGGIEHAFLFAGGSFSTIDFPGSTSARAFGINDVGQVVGRYRDSVGQFHGFLLGRDGFSAVDVPGATFTAARGINNRGEIVGLYTDAAGMTHGFLLSGGIFRTMDFPGAIETDSFGINDVGQMVGGYADSSGKFRGFLAHR